MTSTAIHPKFHTGKVGTALLLVIVYEVGLMGSGRILQAGPLTVRMWLFTLALAYAACAAFFVRRISMTAILLSVWLALVLSMGSAIGLLGNADLSLVAEDIKPLMFFFSLLFFEAVIQTEREVNLVVSALKTLGLILCAAYVAVVGLLLTGVISFGALYSAATKLGTEVAFRGDSGMFIYKGAIYMGVALLFFIFAKGPRAKLAAIICLLCTLATGTRGFILGLAGAILVSLFCAGKGAVRKAVLFIGIVGVGLAAWFAIARPEAQSASDLERVVTFREVVERIHIPTLLLGHGLGNGVPERPVHMEGAFMEVFHKQGLLGLSWWLVVFMVLFDRYRAALRSGFGEIAHPLFLSVVFVFFVSNTNPWITNPIGMAVLLLALACLRPLAHPGPAIKPVPLLSAELYARHALLPPPAPAD